MVSDRGQATIEWTGLALFVALVLGTLATLAPRVDGRGLGSTVSNAITCGARGGCEGRSPSPTVGRALRSVRPEDAAAAEHRRVAPVRSAVSAERAGAAFHALRGVREVAKKVWVVCMGFRRYVYEREHPRIPSEPMPLEEAVDIADECFNPVGFLSGD